MSGVGVHPNIYFTRDPFTSPHKREYLFNGKVSWVTENFIAIFEKNKQSKAIESMNHSSTKSRHGLMKYMG